MTIGNSSSWKPFQWGLQQPLQIVIIISVEKLKKDKNTFKPIPNPSPFPKKQDYISDDSKFSRLGWEPTSHAVKVACCDLEQVT